MNECFSTSFIPNEFQVRSPSVHLVAQHCQTLRMNFRPIFAEHWNTRKRSIARSKFCSIVIWRKNTWKLFYSFSFRIHIMAGKPSTLGAPENDETYLRFAHSIKSFLSLWLFNFVKFPILSFWWNRNLKFAAEHLESTGIIGVIEPINNYSLPGYYLSDYDKGVMWNWVYILKLQA